MSFTGNPRWGHYARVHGVERDQVRGPKFVSWIGERWNEWCALTGRHRHSLNEQDHVAFDEWLAKWERP